MPERWTPRDQEYLRKFQAWLCRYRRPPTLRELAREMGVCHQAVDHWSRRACRQGYLAREPGGPPSLVRCHVEVEVGVEFEVELEVEVGAEAT